MEAHDRASEPARMTRERTGASSRYGGASTAPPSASLARAGHPGLVLLYAPEHEEFAPAHPFLGAELLIGREPTCHVCVPEQAVSRQHARISRESDRWVLRDLASRNGTLVDGAYVTAIELEHLHEIRIGDTVFKFVEHGAERFAAYGRDGVTTERRARDVTALVGGAQMDAIAADLERIAATSLSCVVSGETGTGKEVAARELHRLSGRGGSFQAINCAAIPTSLLESELFGYRRGAFSGADRDKPGLVKLADGGTLFLDEIGDMPLDAQGKLLRVLQSREVFPLGGTIAEPVDLRVVCATHRDLHRLVSEGRFRADLFARLNEHTVRLPPLRERKEDIYRLSRLFVTRYGAPRKALSFSFVVALLHYDWPFNVRELESCMKRAVALSDGHGDVIDTPQLPDAVREHMASYGQRARVPGPSEGPPPLERPSLVAAAARPVEPAPKRPSEAELRALLRAHAGNVASVGRQLGKDRMQVHRWLKRYGIHIDDYRA
jgi:transcriptional regulator with PAS, ATPase and Fis domain